MGEGQRGCGYRKIGALYMVGGGLAAPCLKMPAELSVCPCCDQGIKFFRGWKWVNAKKVFGGDCVDSGIVKAVPEYCTVCPFDSEKAGLMWVGKRFYSPESFIKEAFDMGISKRVFTIPQGFKLGETWVLLAHKEAVTKEVWVDVESGDTIPIEEDRVRTDENGKMQMLQVETCGGVFYAYVPKRVELTVTQKMLDEMSDLEKEGHKARGITYFIVEDDEKHRGSVYDFEENEEEEGVE